MADDDTQALVPVRVQLVEFYGDTLLAAEGSDGTIYVPLVPICRHLGLSWPGQFERIQRDPVLRKLTISLRVSRMQIDDQARVVVALPLKYLAGWLFGVQVSR